MPKMLGIGLVGDAFKFCSYEIPDENRVKSYLIENVSGCRNFFYVPSSAETPRRN